LTKIFKTANSYL